MRDVVADWTPGFEELLRRHCRLVAPGAPIQADAMLTKLGVDSLDIVEMIVAIEDELEVVIPEQLLTPEVFATPATIWQAVDKLRAGHQ